MNEAVGVNNGYTMDGGEKRLFCPFKSQEFWKCIGYILSAVTYGNEGKNICCDIIKASCSI